MERTERQVEVVHMAADTVQSIYLLLTPDMPKEVHFLVPNHLPHASHDPTIGVITLR